MSLNDSILPHHLAGLHKSVRLICHKQSLWLCIAPDHHFFSQGNRDNEIIAQPH